MYLNTVNNIHAHVCAKSFSENVLKIATVRFMKHIHTTLVHSFFGKGERCSVPRFPSSCVWRRQSTTKSPHEFTNSANFALIWICIELKGADDNTRYIFRCLIKYELICYALNLIDIKRQIPCECDVYMYNVQNTN